MSWGKGGAGKRGGPEYGFTIVLPWRFQDGFVSGPSESFMDSHRATRVDRERSNIDMHPDDEGAGDDEIDREPPVSVGQDERRMQVRAYNHWSSLLGRGPLPPIQDLNSAELPGFAENAVVLDFSTGIENPAIRMLGEKLADECGADHRIKRLGDVPAHSLLSRITDRYRQVLANRAPVGFEAECINQRGHAVVYRGILLPFANDGEAIQQIMGVINWKELADATTTAALRRELEGAALAGFPQAAEASPCLDEPSGARLREWADGPDTAEAADTGVMAPGASDLADLLALARDLAIRPRAPNTRVARLVFGGDCDTIRLAEITLALAQARHPGLGRAALAAYLAEAPGGLKAVVRQARRPRRTPRGRVCRSIASLTVADKLRERRTLSWEDRGVDGCEYGLLLIRQTDEGDVFLLGEVKADGALLESAVRKLPR